MELWQLIVLLLAFFGAVGALGKVLLAQIVGSDVLQSMRNGVDGAAYKIRALATLSDGRRLARALVVPVRAV